MRNKSWLHAHRGTGYVMCDSDIGTAMRCRFSSSVNSIVSCHYGSCYWFLAGWRSSFPLPLMPFQLTIEPIIADNMRINPAVPQLMMGVVPVPLVADSEQILVLAVSLRPASCSSSTLHLPQQIQFIQFIHFINILTVISRLILLISPTKWKWMHRHNPRITL